MLLLAVVTCCCYLLLLLVGGTIGIRWWWLMFYGHFCRLNGPHFMTRTYIIRKYSILETSLFLLKDVNVDVDIWSTKMWIYTFINHGLLTKNYTWIIKNIIIYVKLGSGGLCMRRGRDVMKIYIFALISSLWIIFKTHDLIFLFKGLRWVSTLIKKVSVSFCNK